MLDEKAKKYFENPRKLKAVKTGNGYYEGGING